MSIKGQMSMSEFWRLARSRANEGQLSTARQIAEATILYLTYGVSPSYYQLSTFWDQNVSWTHKTSHLSTAEYRKKIDELNPPNYRKLSQNKLAEKAMLSILDIPTPEYLGYYREGAASGSETRTLTSPDNLERFITARSDLDKICFKGVEGWAGQSFEITDIYRSDDGLKLLRARTQEMLTVGQFCSDVLNQGQHEEGSLMETFLVQHDTLAAINPSSLNTLRLWVLQVNEHMAQVLLGYLRIGRAGAIVDNQGDRVVATVNLDSGLLEPAIDGSPARITFPTHPDHGASIEGVKIPWFISAKQLAERAVLEFPGIRFAGVDVAIAPDGPRIIELNVSPGRTGAAYTKTPSKMFFP